MTAPAKLNFKMYQGSTFTEVLRWESSKKIYKPITAITQAAPCVITATSHGLPNGWRAKVTNVVGMKEINSTDVYHNVTKLTSDTVELNAVNSLGYTTYTSGGVLEYNEPVDLTGYTARMQLRLKLEDAVPITEYNTTNGGIVIDSTACTITINAPAATTTGYTFTSAIYSLELVSGTGVVTSLCTGKIDLVKEITR